jgi:transposase
MSDGTSTSRTIAVGIDTARYGHHVTFLYQDRQPAADPLTVTENEAGYRLLRERFQQLEQRLPEVLFRVRIDAAGQYATNLERFLRRLPHKTVISVGEPKRNKDYHAAVSPKHTSDRTESYAMARYAIAEVPEGTADVPDEFFLLREVVSRLEAQTKDTTRAVNRLHNLLARVLPELPVIVKDLRYKWVLALLEKYPTAQRIAAARTLHKIPYLKPEMAEKVQAVARTTVGSLTGAATETLVRECVQQVRGCLEAKKRLEKLLKQSFRELPRTGHVQVESIPGIGTTTAAVLVAKIIDIGRFETPENLVGYFGVFPQEDSSGVTRDGTPLPTGTQHMSTKGSDIVRSYLWNAAKSAIEHNPAVRDLYARLRATGKRGDVALGHCMRKLLHQVFGVWASDKPFDEKLAQPRHNSPQIEPAEQQAAGDKEEETVAGHKRVACPQRKVVTATDSTVTQPASTCQPQAGSVDYAYLREQITMEQVLGHLGYADRLHGRGAERRGPCPFHTPSGQQSKSFCVNLDKHLFHCTNPKCDLGGNALDLWRLAKGLPLYEAALDLAETFHLSLQRTEKRQPVTQY